MVDLRAPVAMSTGEEKSRIVFLVSADVGFQGLAQTVRDRMPAFEVALEDPEGPPSPECKGARLVLVTPGKSTDVMAYLSACRRRFPDATFALMVSGNVGNIDCRSLMDAGLVSGVVPVEMPLEVWIAVLALLVAGGEYCPPKLLVQPLVEKGHKAPRNRLQMPDFAAHGLTPREGQILELIARGFQNKLIANQMCLSEHTVKVHVHNLFTKLGVSNRTQAASKCRDWMSGTMRPRQSRQTVETGAEMHLAGR